MSEINGKSLKGLEDRGLVNFECVKCDKILLILQQTFTKGDNQGEILTRVVVKCRKCKEFSPVQQIVGRFHPGASNDNMSFDILDDDCGSPEADVLFEAWDK